MEPGDRAASLQEAAAHADLGLPFPGRTPSRLVKRLVARLSWPFLHHQVAFNHAVLAALAALEEGLRATVESQVTELRANLDDQAGGLGSLALQLQGLREAVEAQLSDVGDMVRQQEVAHRLQLDLVQRQAFQRHHEALGSLRSELTEIGLRIEELQNQLTEAQSSGVRERAEAQLLKVQVDLFLNEVRRSLPRAPAAEELAAHPSALDTTYPALQDFFRGSFDLIKERAAEYLDDILTLEPHEPVLDLGSGRGEWLEVLKKSGVEAYGVELNEHYVSSCLERGLDVRRADAVDHLASVPEGSLAAVTAFHLAEHLPVERLLELIDLSVRALRPGGVLIVETPNPDNLVVGASTFYLDPSHLRPLNPEFLRFLVASRGFVEVDVRFLHPAAGLHAPDAASPWASDLLPLVAAINDRLYGALDYAVVARRV
ncbi:MAG: methyltransferase domain-containing protein [Acidimicrobiales bacterium]